MTEAVEVPPIRLGIVGCGWISPWHGRASAQVPDVEIVACCDARPEAAAAFRERYGCERDYTDHREMLAEHELDAVLLATWPPQHLEQVLACLDAGIRSILCEKSITMSVGDVLEIHSAARAADALVMEGFMYRHHPAMRALDELLAAGELGEIDNVSAAFDTFDPEEPGPDEPRDWRQNKDLGGGVPFDFTPYCVSACNHVAGAPPERVMAVSGLSERYGTIARLYGMIEYENGVVGVVRSSKKANFGFELRVSGTTGNATLPRAWDPEAILSGERPEAGEATDLVLSRSTGVFTYDTETIAIPPGDPYAEQLRDFAAAVRGEAAPAPTLAESVLNVVTINALLQSADEQAAVPVVLPDAVRRELTGASDTQLQGS